MIFATARPAGEGLTNDGSAAVLIYTAVSIGTPNGSRTANVQVVAGPHDNEAKLNQALVDAVIEFVDSIGSTVEPQNVFILGSIYRG